MPSAAQHPWERPLGARVAGGGAAEFRVWAPTASSISLEVAGRTHPLTDAGYGVYEAALAADADEDYAFVVDGQPLPDPCSRWQPQGLRGRSRLLDARTLPAARDGFRIPAPDELVIYELHTGTFTAAGTFAAIGEHLEALAQLGVTAIELMPVAEFPGARGWGYDGVYLSAAQSSYGGPIELAELVAAAHAHGLAVILDVVYNHVGASGAQALTAFGPYFTDTYETPWGRAINYDDEWCDPVREWVCQSAEYWVAEMGFDGLRLDAIHAIFDSSAEHIVRAVARRVHAIKPGAYVIAESGLNDPRVMRPPQRGGYDCDAEWADDFHHALRTLVTDERDGYYAEFGRVAQLTKAFRRPHVHDGGFSEFRRRRFGAPADDVPVQRFVVFSQDHDQVGNRAFGDRMPARARPLAAFCTLLSPFIPMLFMGEEYGEPAPFQFFSNHIDPEIAEATRTGRRQEFARFAAFGDAEEIPDPEDPATFERSKLTRQVDEPTLALYRRLIEARRELPPGDADEIRFDEDRRWLLVRRGSFEIVCNFADDEIAIVPVRGTAIELTTDPNTQIGGGSTRLPPMSGALIA
ncbi:MAG TPA: malto-oligosyltrehalose trehalohydrolase [Solirubrobacteraceae bacterium]|nr:malto-oligosyltrehalose trehalohydrolase [Solirubrobacteraceae bacterium]